MGESENLALYALVAENSLIPQARLQDALERARQQGLKLEQVLLSEREISGDDALRYQAMLRERVRRCQSCAHEQYLVDGQSTASTPCELCGGTLADPRAKPATTKPPATKPPATKPPTTSGPRPTLRARGAAVRPRRGPPTTSGPRPTTSGPRPGAAGASPGTTSGTRPNAASSGASGGPASGGPASGPHARRARPRKPGATTAAPRSGARPRPAASKTTAETPLPTQKAARPNAPSESGNVSAATSPQSRADALKAARVAQARASRKVNSNAPNPDAAPVKAKPSASGSPGSGSPGSGSPGSGSPGSGSPNRGGPASGAQARPKRKPGSGATPKAKAASVAASRAKSRAASRAAARPASSAAARAKSETSAKPDGAALKVTGAMVQDILKRAILQARRAARARLEEAELDKLPERAAARAKREVLQALSQRLDEERERWSQDARVQAEQAAQDYLTRDEELSRVAEKVQERVSQTLSSELREQLREQLDDQVPAWLRDHADALPSAPDSAAPAEGVVGASGELDEDQRERLVQQVIDRVTPSLLAHLREQLERAMPPAAGEGPHANAQAIREAATKAAREAMQQPELQATLTESLSDRTWARVEARLQEHGLNGHEEALVARVLERLPSVPTPPPPTAPHDVLEDAVRRVLDDPEGPWARHLQHLREARDDASGSPDGGSPNASGATVSPEALRAAVAHALEESWADPQLMARWTDRLVDPTWSRLQADARWDELQTRLADAARASAEARLDEVQRAWREDVATLARTEVEGQLREADLSGWAERTQATAQSTALGAAAAAASEALERAREPWLRDAKTVSEAQIRALELDTWPQRVERKARDAVTVCIDEREPEWERARAEATQAQVEAEVQPLRQQLRALTLTESQPLYRASSAALGAMRRQLPLMALCFASILFLCLIGMGLVPSTFTAVVTLGPSGAAYEGPARRLRASVLDAERPFASEKAQAQRAALDHAGITIVGDPGAVELIEIEAVASSEEAARAGAQALREAFTATESELTGASALREVRSAQLVVDHSASAWLLWRGIVLGAILALTAGVIAEFWIPTYHDPEDLEADLGLPVLVTIPRIG